ncbi:MAG: hypothetical protein IKA51_04340 [Clostridia bacterium]|nr:hypothetical protein [Clostridia bacterium]
MPIKARKFKTDPLFFAVFAVFCIFEGVFVTSVIYLSAIFHELGHLFAARLCKAKIKSFSLLPIGMRIELELDGIKYRSQALIAIMGPLFNVVLWLISLAVARLCYHPLLSFCAAANFILAAVNVMPALPLDGGRITEALLCMHLELDRAVAVTEIITLITLIALFLFGVYLLVSSGYNFSLLLMSSFFLIMLLKEHLKPRNSKKTL